MDQLPRDLFYYIAQFVPDERDLLFISKRLHSLALELPDVRIWREHRPKYGIINAREFAIIRGSPKMIRIITPAGLDLSEISRYGNINAIDRYLDIYNYWPFKSPQYFFTYICGYGRGSLEIVKHLLNRLCLDLNDIDDLAHYIRHMRPEIADYMIKYLKSRK